MLYTSVSKKERDRIYGLKRVGGDEEQSKSLSWNIYTDIMYVSIPLKKKEVIE